MVLGNREGRKKKQYGVSQFTKWKQTVMEILATDDVISKLLYYDTPDCLTRPSLTEDEREDLVDNYVYGYRYIPDVAESKRAYISLSLSNFVPQEGFRQFSDDYIHGYLFFYILVDTAIMNTDTGYRNDLILARIYELFQEKRNVIGMGELRMEACTELWQHSNKFGGYTIGFKVVDMK